MPLPPDPSPTLSDYAHPRTIGHRRLVVGHLGSPGLAIVESDEDVLLYDVGHIPARSRSTGTPTSTTRRVRDYIDGERFAD